MSDKLAKFENTIAVSSGNSPEQKYEASDKVASITGHLQSLAGSMRGEGLYMSDEVDDSSFSKDDLDYIRDRVSHRDVKDILEFLRQLTKE